MDFEINDEKTAGYIILLVGLIIIIYSLISVLPVFTQGNVPVEILKTTSDSTQDSSITTNGSSINLDLNQIVQPLYPIFNVVVWLIVAFFIVVVGSKVAHIGIKMIKLPSENKRKVKEAKINVENKSDKVK
ncbi:MAG: hypothetical protein V5A68_01095 [Candidatus Thermoplasmatota archaeon]